MNTEQLSFGQRIDPENNLCELWLTHGALDWIKQQDWSDKVVLMFGAGMGDTWLAKKCKKLHVVERNEDWMHKAMQKCAANGVFVNYYYRPCNDSSGQQEFYLVDLPECDVLINDDAYRYEVIEKALTLPRPLTLVVDNWMQDYVFYCPKGVELLKDFEQKIFEQHDHKDHEGNKWKTAVFFIK